MAYEYVETEEGWKQVIIPDPPEKAPATQMIPQGFQQRPMLLQMPMMQQPSQMPFPLISFLFPRIAMLLTTMQGRYGQRTTMVQHITQIVRDKNGYISEIVEFVR